MSAPDPKRTSAVLRSLGAIHSDPMDGMVDEKNSKCADLTGVLWLEMNGDTPPLSFGSPSRVSLRPVNKTDFFLFCPPFICHPVCFDQCCGFKSLFLAH